jgi:hypothetical protein
MCPTLVWTEIKFFLHWCDDIIAMPTISVPIHHNFTISWSIPWFVCFCCFNPCCFTIICDADMTRLSPFIVLPLWSRRMGRFKREARTVSEIYCYATCFCRFNPCRFTVICDADTTLSPFIVLPFLGSRRMRSFKRRTWTVSEMYCYATWSLFTFANIFVEDAIEVP